MPRIDCSKAHSTAALAREAPSATWSAPDFHVIAGETGGEAQTRADRLLAARGCPGIEVGDRGRELYRAGKAAGAILPAVLRSADGTRRRPHCRQA